MSEYVADALIVQDGTNPSFFAYLPIEEAIRIEACGLENAVSIILRETDDRPIPESLSQGFTEIKDILVKEESKERLEVNKWHHIN